MATVGGRNKVIIFLYVKVYNPYRLKSFRPFIVKISRYQKFGDILKNFVENYPILNKIYRN